MGHSQRKGSKVNIYFLQMHAIQVTLFQPLRRLLDESPYIYTESSHCAKELGISIFLKAQHIYELMVELSLSMSSKFDTLYALSQSHLHCVK